MASPQQQIVDTVGDLSAAGVTVGTLLGYLPALAALFTLVWTGIRIYELITGRKFSGSKAARFASKLLNKM